MKQLLYLALASVILCMEGRPVAAQSLSPDVVKQVTQAVIELCRGGTSSGKSEAIEITGKGNATILVLKRLADLGVDGRVEFSQREWQGIQAAIPEHWDQSAYNDCVNPNVRLFLEKLEKSSRATTGSIKLYEYNSSAVCGGHSYVSVVIYRESAHRPKQEIRLIGADVESGSAKLMVGQSITTTSKCRITLAGTGFDRDFYAHLDYQSLAKTSP